MAQGWSHGPVGAVVAAWPAVSLVGSYELLVWLIRRSGAVERGLSAEHFGEGAACRAAGGPARAAAVDSEHYSRNGHELSAQGWRPTGQSATHASAQHEDRVPEANADNDAAVAAYRLSVQVGNPFSERKLAQTFGRTSRRWARARIAEARQSLTECEPAGLASIADGLPNVATDSRASRPRSTALFALAMASPAAGRHDELVVMHRSQVAFCRGRCWLRAGC
jgi:hypothetical protein